MKAVLIHSDERYDSFRKKLGDFQIECIPMQFGLQEWIDFDYGKVDFLIYYPTFAFSSNHPLAVYKAQDNIDHIHRNFPHLVIYPDPKITYFYNDKYRQFLFLKRHSFPMPETIPLLSMAAVDEAHRKLGYPMVIKNRFGAGGGAVFLVNNPGELHSFYRMSQFDFMHLGALRFLYKVMVNRVYLYLLIKERRMRYPFLSPPLLAQKFIHTDRDLKTVVGKGRVVEAHWRFQASKDQWKVNIDGGGIGQWSHIPRSAVELSQRLAAKLSSSWINLDLLPHGDDFLITEFSPVWHHYAYREKPSFVYKDDYNLPVSLEESLDLERIIIQSFLEKDPEITLYGQQVS
jgi:hypothetical protein